MMLWLYKKYINELFCLICGSVIPLAFAPYNYYLLAILSPACLLNIWSSSKPRDAFRYGYLFGLGMFGTGINWLHISINMFGGINLAGSLLLTLLFVLYLALYPAMVGYLGRRLFARSRLVFLLLAIPALWVVAEWCRAWIFTGFSWLQLGYSQIDSPLQGLAALSGVYGVSWAVMITAGLLVCLYRSNNRPRIIIVLSIAVLWFSAWSVKNKDWTQVSHSNVSVALIQAGIPQELKWKRELRKKSLDLYLALTKPHWGANLIIWPETAIPAFYHEMDDFMHKLHGLAQSNNSSLLVGIPVKNQETNKYYNSAVMLNDDTAMYYKHHLVPFGEYLPFDSLLRPTLSFLKIPMSDFSSGENISPVLNSQDISAGVSICYEDTFGREVIRALPAANVLVNISNDAWFGDSIAPHQHLQMARFRALETGRYMLRSTNTGITAIIDEKGKIIKQSAQFRAVSLSARISLFQGSTPYARLGDLPVILITLVLLSGISFYNRHKTIAKGNNKTAI